MCVLSMYGFSSYAYTVIQALYTVAIYGYVGLQTQMNKTLQPAQFSPVTYEFSTYIYN